MKKLKLQLLAYGGESDDRTYTPYFHGGVCLPVALDGDLDRMCLNFIQSLDEKFEEEDEPTPTQGIFNRTHTELVEVFEEFLENQGVMFHVPSQMERGKTHLWVDVGIVAR